MKEMRINIRPLFYFYIKGNHYTIPDFVIEVFRIFNISYICGHHEFALILRFIKWQWIIEITKIQTIKNYENN